MGDNWEAAGNFSHSKTECQQRWQKSNVIIFLVALLLLAAHFHSPPILEILRFDIINLHTSASPQKTISLMPRQRQ